MSRETFLNRVREAAQRGRAYRVHVDEIPEGTGYVGAREGDLCAAMAAEVVEVGGAAHVVTDSEAAREQLLDLLDQYNVRCVLMWQHELLRRLGLQEVLGDAGIDWLDHDRLSNMDEAAARQAVMAADIGVTSCDWAIAETGSLVVHSRPGQERMASLVTPVHIAVVERRQIVPDLFDVTWNRSPDLFESDASSNRSGDLFHELPSNISIITGPSKTGDIELTLTTGVHGPGKWHVIIIS